MSHCQVLPAAFSKTGSRSCDYLVISSANFYPIVSVTVHLEGGPVAHDQHRIAEMLERRTKALALEAGAGDREVDPNSDT